MTLPKPVLYVLRLAVTAGAMTLAFLHVSLHDVLPLLVSIPWPHLMLALLLTHLGQVVSALRTRYLLHCQQIDFPHGPSLKLHYVGGLFNVFLPGGAGGDAYKAWWLKRHRQGKMLNMVVLMIAGRLNGMWALGVLTCLLAFFSPTIRQVVPQAPWVIPATAAIGTLCYSLLARLVLREPVERQAITGLYSLALQSMLLAAAYVLCFGLHLSEQALEYTALFMLSCILAMLPISIGGMGVRELVLLHGSDALGLSKQAGVSLAFSFTLLSLTIPLVGAYIYHFNAPENDA